METNHLGNWKWRYFHVSHITFAGSRSNVQAQLPPVVKKITSEDFIIITVLYSIFRFIARRTASRKRPLKYSLKSKCNLHIFIWWLVV